MANISQATGAASITTLKLMTDPNVPAAVRLRAAERVLGQAIKGIELEDIEAVPNVTDHANDPPILTTNAPTAFPAGRYCLIRIDLCDNLMTLVNHHGGETRQYCPRGRYRQDW
jgi:hypothetical protein